MSNKQDLLVTNECNKVKVLCLGDSLTAGFVSENIHAPYSDHLAALFMAHGRNDIVLVNAGVDGDTVKDIQTRLPVLLRQHQYQHVVLLGGTNDLGQIDTFHAADTAEETVAHISFNPIYRLLMEAPALKSFLQLTVPYTTFDRLDVSEKNNKDALNNRIVKDPCPKKRILDLNEPSLAFNHLLMSEQERDEYWQDALHYSTPGYLRMASCIYPTLASMMQE